VLPDKSVALAEKDFALIFGEDAFAPVLTLKVIQIKQPKVEIRELIHPFNPDVDRAPFVFPLLLRSIDEHGEDVLLGVKRHQLDGTLTFA
jgi:hypothetical protein